MGQKQALLHVLGDPDRITDIRGLAESGKTRALRELDRALKEAGYHVEFCAPTSAAVEVLRQEGFAAVTLARLLEGGRHVSGLRSVTILDEAGAVGLLDMRRLLGLRGRLILSGDTGPHASVARGDVLRIIEEHSPYAFGELTQIRRQRRAVE